MVCDGTHDVNIGVGLCRKEEEAVFRALSSAASAGHRIQLPKVVVDGLATRCWVMIFIAKIGDNILTLTRLQTKCPGQNDMCQVSPEILVKHAITFPRMLSLWYICVVGTFKTIRCTSPSSSFLVSALISIF